MALSGTEIDYSAHHGEWLPKSGFVPDDRPALEIYRNNPYDTPANDLITDLLIPLR